MHRRAYDVAQLLVDLICREVPLNAAFAQQLVAVGGEQLGALGLGLKSTRRRAWNRLSTAHIRLSWIVDAEVRAEVLNAQAQQAFGYAPYPARSCNDWRLVSFTSLR